ncbi:MAG: hypothetical protein JW847_00100 [Candidatus Omnitrophica bacterium]|nr:hypothetical protein [Candidatus Omnitrophota bacterium]
MIVCFAVSLLAVVWPMGASWADGGGYSTGAYSELEANETYWDKISDWFATAGMSEEEKAVIKSRRRAMRKYSDSQKAVLRKKKEIIKKKRQALEKLRNKENSGND